MQIKIISVPAIGGEGLNDDLNRFLRSKRVLQVDSQLVTDGQGAFWTFCIKYLNEEPSDRERFKKDFRQEMDEASFERFNRLREIRKQIARKEVIPAYAVFTDQELAALARIENLTLDNMKKVKGVGEKKVEKYGAHFVAQPDENEKS
jgi:superfamily II DNA helicase RecQ